MKIGVIVKEAGFEWRVESRRSYPRPLRGGRDVFTWVEARRPGGEWIILGDPWPRYRPSRRSIRALAEEVLPKRIPPRKCVLCDSRDVRAGDALCVSCIKSKPGRCSLCGCDMETEKHRVIVGAATVVVAETLSEREGFPGLSRSGE